MKKELLLLLSFAAVSSTCLASDDGDENYHPFVVEGKTWVCQVQGKAQDGRVDCSYTIKGDTIIDGELWKKMYRSWIYGPDCYAFLKEQDKKVLIIFNGYTQKHLFYDFGLEVASSFDSDFAAIDEHVTLVAVRKIGIDGKSYKQMEIRVRRRYSGYDEEYMEKWIEGIGSLFGPLRLGPYDYSGYFFTKTCYENGECIFDRDEYLAANTDGITSTASAAPAVNAPIYDLQGRRLNGMPEKGIYIQNGKKVKR